MYKFYFEFHQKILLFEIFIKVKLEQMRQQKFSYWAQMTLSISVCLLIVFLLRILTR